MNMDMKINSKGLLIIKTCEGLAFKSYKCPAGVWSLGYGHTKGVYDGQSCTLELAEVWLLEDIKDCYYCINNMVKSKLNENQFSAICCFIYNVGCQNFSKSTLLQKINKWDMRGAALEFPRWNKVGRSEVSGLTTRRKLEQKLFNSEV